MRFLNLVTFLIIFPCILKAQVFKKSYVEGYIVTKSDTIKGLIRQKRVYTGKIRYKLSEDGTDSKIKLKNIESLKAGTVLYKKVIYRNRPMMMKELIYGPVSLYSLPVENMAGFQDHGFQSPYHEEEYFLMKENEVIKVPKEAFHKILSAFFDNYPDLADKIFSKFYKYENLIDIVTKYNYWYNYKRSPEK